MKKVLCPFCFNKIVVGKGTWCPIVGCPSNKNKIVLPDEVFTHKPFPIMVVGGSNAGKTVFLSALASQLINSKFWSSLWDVKMIHYNGNEFYDRIGNLFTQPYQLPNSTETEDTTLPLLFSVTFRGMSFKKTPLGFPRFFPTKLLINFTDPAGEHFVLSNENQKTAKGKYRILNGHIKAALAIMDPIEVNDNWSKFLSKNRIKKEEIGGKKIVSASAALEMLSLIPKKTRRNLPLALCLTKLDEITGENTLLREDSIPAIDCFCMGEEHDTYRLDLGKISIPELEGIDKTLRSIFFKNRCNHIFNSIGISTTQISNEENPTELWDANVLKKAAFRYHAFFGVSSLGCVRILNDATLDKPPMPFRVLDPFLWILWQYGYLGATTKKTL